MGALAIIIGVAAVIIAIVIYLLQKKKSEKTHRIVEESKKELDAIKSKIEASFEIQTIITPKFDLSEIFHPTLIRGRTTELGEITGLLNSGERVITLLGMGGIGKSVLACLVANQVKDNFAAVWGFSFKTDTSLDGFLKKLGIHLFGGQIQQAGEGQLRAAVDAKLSSGKYLLILDNYESVLQAQDRKEPGAIALGAYLNTVGLQTNLLVTTREKPSRISKEHVFKIGVVRRGSAMLIIEDELSDKKELFAADKLDKIAEKLLDHPLACRLVGGYLAEIKIDPNQAIEKVREFLLKATGKATDDHLTSFDNSLALSLEALSADERRLIEAVSIFQGPFTAEAAGFIAEFDESIPVLDRLSRRSLVECREVPHYPKVEVYTIHALIRETIWEKADQKRWLQKLSQYTLLIGSDISAQRYVSDIDFLVSVQQMLPDLVRGARNMGEGGTAALHNLGILFEGQGDYLTALRLFEESMKLEPPDNKKGIAQSFHQIGMIHHDRGNLDSALKQYQQAQEIFDELGAKREQAAVLHQIGRIHELRGDLDAALKQYQQSIKIEKELGNKAGVAQSLHQIGMIHQDRGDLDAALEHYQQSLEIEISLGNQLGIGQSYDTIGPLLFEMGKKDEGLKLVQQALEIFERIGAKPNVERAQHNLEILRGML
ncbi:MAG: tetratricopeptide repeat protein [Candidatus Alcyoniella australis]|nr:tetratricopeptide repeat protein [Candidatus Alcyoniella australis]